MQNSNDFPRNSNAVQKREKIAPVANAKLNDGQKKESFIAVKDRNLIFSYLYYDIVMPYLKRFISEIWHNTIDVVLYGKNTPRPLSTGSTYTYSNGPTAPKYAYNQQFYRTPNQTYSQAPTTNKPSYDSLVFETRGQAEEVLVRMNEIISQFNVVSILDLFDLAGVTNHNYTDDNYGWINLSQAETFRYPMGGYGIRFPKAVPLDK